jgi:tRNA1(Val) A37 N6-methylase TrmN6
MDLPKQNLSVNIYNKQYFGEVHTPYIVVEKMFNLFPQAIFSDPTKKWLDPCAGRGFFSIYLLEKLMVGLEECIPDKTERKAHILSNMIWLVELNDIHIPELKSIFPNVYSGDFLLTKRETFPDGFDVVIGNPPFNFGGPKKVPTNNKMNKKKDGTTIWSRFIKHSLSLLNNGGHLLFIVPSIWMKEDKEKMYFYMTQYDIQKIHCLTNTQMNMFFKGHAQTPSCFFLLEKKSTKKKVLLYDQDFKEYIPFSLRKEHIIPVSCSKILTQLLPYVDKYGSLQDIQKSNLPSKSVTLSESSTKDYPYINIKTCIIKNKIHPELVFEYSNKPCPYYGKKKLVLAHGMYGFPFIDTDGKYGISNRDKYVYVSDNISDLKKLHSFLSSDLVFYLYNATRYRMKYLEKYIFSLLPNVLMMSEKEMEMFRNIEIPYNKNIYTNI